MTSRFHVAALWLAITFSPLAALLLRLQALRSPVPLQEPGSFNFSIELVGWLFITGLILGLTVHGIATYANLSQKALRLLTKGLVALMLIYIGIWLGYQLTGQGLYGERLFAGLTLIYSGIGHLLLARFTSLDSLSKRPYITSLISWGAGIFYIIRHFIR